MSPDSENLFQPTASWEILQHRAVLLKRLRAFFEQHDFLEVETPLLSADTVVDLHLNPIPVTLYTDPRRIDQGDTYWLQTSPEFCMKRLLASGAKAIYQVTKSFRAGERGTLHNPEFTIVEWYRIEDDMWTGIDLLERLIRDLLDVGKCERLSYAEAFQRHVGLDPLQAESQELAGIARNMGLHLPTDLDPDDRDTWLQFLLTECVEPHLGNERPTVLYHYPANQAALARIAADEPRVAERFEIYVQGIELANGYHELTDADELKRRMDAENHQRLKDGKTSLPENNRLIQAMEHGLPDCTGVALGFDRLVMLATGAASIEQVMPFPIDRA